MRATTNTANKSRCWVNAHHPTETMCGKQVDEKLGFTDIANCLDCGAEFIALGRAIDALYRDGWAIHEATVCGWIQWQKNRDAMTRRADHDS